MLRDTRLYRLLFFFLTIPRPPTSTLFPYTTLFRSFRVPGEAKTVTFVNNDAATDVYISDKRQELLAKFPPDAGQKIGKGGLVLQWPAYKGTAWLRANGATVTQFVALY